MNLLPRRHVIRTEMRENKNTNGWIRILVADHPNNFVSGVIWKTSKKSFIKDLISQNGFYWFY